MKVRKSAYYDWRKRPGEVISADILHLYRRMKALFEQSRQSLGSREMMKKLRAEGIEVGRYRVRKLMAKIGLRVRHWTQILSQEKLKGMWLISKIITPLGG